VTLNPDPDLIQLHNGNGTLYGWDLTQRNLIFGSVGLGPGSIWGKAVGVDQFTSTLTRRTRTHSTRKLLTADVCVCVCARARQTKRFW
jgi:hypothetical protein